VSNDHASDKVALRAHLEQLWSDDGSTGIGDEADGGGDSLFGLTCHVSQEHRLRLQAVNWNGQPVDRLPCIHSLEHSQRSGYPRQ
jgi:hypothetical protein